MPLAVVLVIVAMAACVSGLRLGSSVKRYLFADWEKVSPTAG